MLSARSDCFGCGRDLRTIRGDETISKVLTERGPVWLCAACHEKVIDESSVTSTQDVADQPLAGEVVSIDDKRRARHQR
jgi:hypothetical protein